LDVLLRLPGQRQRVLIALAVRAGLVQRLWFGYLKQAQQAAGGQGACGKMWSVFGHARLLFYFFNMIYTYIYLLF
jgi:hypothetical protein